MTQLIAITRVLVLIEFVIGWGFGWRYILSRHFRHVVHNKWRQKPRSIVIADIAFLSIAFVVLNGFVLLVCVWLYRGIVVPRLYDQGSP